ncbi:TolC family protein [Algoriphagus halophilus]|uniref:Outer membrane protein TolC n=1 Tax=Algoriphagus halophilus TaxID=226505 RepID=A0A1N6DHL2_9BACT|nr:TolC family protein [Algoriphagus halophilus]SIN70216.1 Outer membrane protein TolC [Algoriphagus halophilus]
MFKKYVLLVGMGVLLLSTSGYAQENPPIPQGELTLEQILEYSLVNSPMVKQSQIDQEIGDHEIKASLADWYPQVTLSGAGNYNIKLQTSVIGDQLITFGQPWNSNLMFQVNQTLFNRDQLFASKSSKYYRDQLDKAIKNTRITTIVEVSKAYYDILLAEEQLNVLNENIGRLEKQLKDAKNRYESGLVDKTDYQRASISLSNEMSVRNRVQTSFDARYAYLKQLMGCPEEFEFTVSFDREEMLSEIYMDASEPLVLENRVEYQLMQTQQTLNEIQFSYEKWNYLPQLSASYNYNWLYFNQEFSNLYNQAYPTSSVGLTLSLPIFQGGKRNHRVRVADLQVDRGAIDLQNLGNQITTEYEVALTTYQSDVYAWENIRENMKMAEEVYDIIKLQYDEGIKAYVDLVVAESDLRTAQINHLNAIFQVLESKLDLEKALGLIE